MRWRENVPVSAVTEAGGRYVLVNIMQMHRMKMKYIVMLGGKDSKVMGSVSQQRPNVPSVFHGIEERSE